MKNLVFNLRTAKAQAEGCAKVTKSSRMAKILTTLTLLLTLCVGQMWGDITYSGGHIYFDNSLGINDNTLQICARQSGWTGVSSFSNISNTKLYYVKDPQGSGWGGILGWVVISANPAKSNSNFYDWTSYTWCSAWNTYGFNSGSTYLIVPSSKTKNQSVTTTYYSGGYGAIPKYNAIQAAKKRDTGTTYSVVSGTYPATLSLQGTYLSDNGTSAQSSISRTQSSDGAAKSTYGAVMTGLITHSYSALSSSYYFEGWGTGSTPSVTTSSHSYNISANTTTYAFFSKKYTLTYDRKGTYGTSTLSASVSNYSGTKTSGSSIPTGHQITFTATPASGYVIEGWYSDAACTVSLKNGQNTTYTISSLNANTSVYVKFEQLKTITIKFAHEVTAGWVIQGVTKYPTSGGQSISADGTWVTMTFTNVYAVSNIDLAYSGGDWDYLNTSTKITDDCCYNKNGSLNASCCVPRANPTWGTAPASGAIGGSMTATVSGAPDGATITWTSTNTSAATVNSRGVISYEAAGNTTIKARVQKAAGGDYCELDYTLSQDISVTSGATVTATRTCPAYVSTGAGEVTLDITSTGASSGWYYRIKNKSTGGYYAPDMQSAATNSLSWTMTGGIGAELTTLVVELYNGSNTLICTSSDVTVTGEVAHITYIAAGSNGSVSPKTIYANNNHVHPSITATPNSHYHFKEWTSNNAAASVASATSATTTVTATASGYTITANFAGDQYTITYKDQGGSAFSGTQTSAPTTHTYGTATTLKIPTKTGYTFNGWFTVQDCSSGQVGTASAASLSATGYTSNITLYAKWTEIMSDLSTSCHYDVGNPGYAVPTKSVSSIGIATTSTLTATAAGTGYTFAGWTLSSNVVVTNGDAATDRTITVRTNGNGAAATAQANYTEDLSSPWIVAGGNKIVTTGTPWRTTADANNTMLKKTGHSTESVAYFYVTVTATNTGATNSNYQFKLYNTKTSAYHGLSGDGQYYLLRAESGTQKNLTSPGINIELRADVAGTYEIKVDYSTATPKITVTFPTKYTVTYSVSPSGAANAITTSPSVSSGGYVAAGTSVTFTHAAAKTGYRWYRWENGSGSSLGTESTYTTTINANTTVVAKYTENTYNVTATASAGGSATPTSATAMGQITGGDITASPNTGYNFTNWTITSGSGYFGASGSASTSTTANTKFRPTAAATIQANFTPKTTTITLNNHDATTPGSTSVTATYDAAMPAITLPTKTGYTFGGYWGAPDGSGPQYYNADGSSTQNWNNENATYTLHAKWTPISYTVVLDKQTSAEGYGGNAGTVENQTVTFDATPATVSGTMPTAAQGYGFMGFYTATGGGGSKIINADGTWNNVSGYISGGKWIRDGGATLYAYYKKAEITAITLNSSILDPVDAGEGWVIANPTIAPTPAGTTKICWELLYDNDNPVPAGHESQAYTEGNTKPNQVRFSITGLAAGGYKIKATLRTGDDCSGGTLLSERKVSFTIASGYTVTIQYKDTEGNTIAPSTTSPGKATDWTSISAPTIVGYNFSTWVPGDGITLESSATTNSNRFKATFNGTLTARYTKKRVIYFNNTLGWSNVYVYFYSSNKYWADNYGTGAYAGKYFDGYKPYSDQRHGHMTQIEGTNIWYFDYTAAGYDTYENIAFANMDKSNSGTDNTSNNDLGFFSNTASDPIQVVRRGDHNASLPMFVPLAGQPKTKLNNNKAEYSNQGYWMNYPENTGYALRLFNSSGVEIDSIPFEFTPDKTMPMSVEYILDGSKTYQFKLYRTDGKWFGNNGTMKAGASGDIGETSWEFKEKDGETTRNNCQIKTNAAGTYTFTLDFGNKDGYNYLIGVHYPAAANDFQILYNDNAEWSLGSAHDENWVHPSRIIRARENGVDTISFFVAKDNTPILKARKVSSINASGAITWGSLNISGAAKQDLTVDSSAVYNFKVTQGAAGVINSIQYIGAYTGNYYIRSSALSNKWGNYVDNLDHRMTYSSFSESNANSFGEKYSHYKAKWCPRNTNIAFCIANDYSPCITDTLIQDVPNTYENTESDGTLKYEKEGGNMKYNNDGNAYLDRYSANVRFMWNRKTNKISRAYISAASSGLAQFLVLRAGQELHNENNVAISSTPANSVSLSDNENWIYEARLMIKPGTRFKLYACYAKSPVDPASAQYFRGAYDSDNFTSDDNSVILIGGSSEDYQLARIVYDFKTNRLIAAWMPSGEVSGTNEINADIMVIRDHQESARCITFADASANLSKVKTVYGVMRFNRWILNNRQHPEDQNKDHARPGHIVEDLAEHHPPLPVGQQKSTYERRLYFISFPFDVLVGDIFGFGTYGQYWVIQYYDGLNRAKKGYWMDSKPNWKYVSPTEVAQGYKLEKNQGYILELNLKAMAADNTTFWSNGISTIELYFPSTVNQDILKQTDITIPALSDEYKCTINRGTAEGDRRVKDSYWRCIGVPSYNLYNSALKDGSGNEISWKTNYTWKEDESEFPFIYMWNKTDNTLTPQSTSALLFQPMHAYLTQIKSAIVWTAVSAKPSSIVARRAGKEATKEYNWRIELKQDTTFLDQTYVRMTDLEQVTDNFDFGQDLIKELNSRSNIYTFIGYEKVAANSMTLHTDQTTVIPVGANITTEGDYTFALPDGADGIGVTLIDEETGTRTNLSAGMDYTVYLEKGTHDNRFWLEISPVQNTPTGIEEPTSDSSLKGRAQKRIIDGVLYIVKDGKIFDARGTRVE